MSGQTAHQYGSTSDRELTLFETDMPSKSNLLPDLSHIVRLLDFGPVFQEERYLYLPLVSADS